MTDLHETNFQIRRPARALALKQGAAIEIAHDDLGPIEYFQVEINMDGPVVFELQSHMDLPEEKQFAQIASSDPENYTAIGFLLYRLEVGVRVNSATGKPNAREILVSRGPDQKELSSLDLLDTIVDKFHALRLDPRLNPKQRSIGKRTSTQNTPTKTDLLMIQALKTYILGKLEVPLYNKLREIEKRPLSLLEKAEQIRNLDKPQRPQIGKSFRTNKSTRDDKSL